MGIAFKKIAPVVKALLLRHKELTERRMELVEKSMKQAFTIPTLWHTTSSFRCCSFVFTGTKDIARLRV